MLELSNTKLIQSSKKSSREDDEENEEPYGGAIEMAKVIPTASPGSG